LEIVFGRISEKIKIARVKVAENNIRFWSPYSLATIAPATDAPIVLAMVLRVSMAVIGSSISALNICR